MVGYRNEGKKKRKERVAKRNEGQVPFKERQKKRGRKDWEGSKGKMIRGEGKRQEEERKREEESEDVLFLAWQS